MTKETLQHLQDLNAKLRAEIERLKSKPKAGRPGTDNATRAGIAAALEEGLSYRATAKRVGVSDATVRRIAKTEPASEMIESLRAELAGLQTSRGGHPLIDHATQERIRADLAAGLSGNETARRNGVAATTVWTVAKQDPLDTVESLRAEIERQKARPKGGARRISDATRARILADLADGMTKVEAAKRAGVSDQTVRRIAKAGR